MIERSYNQELLEEATECIRDMVPLTILEQWWENPNHVMLREGDSVGIASLEYPGVYTIHWYFKVRGRAAINLARDMVSELFEKYEAKTLRGLVRADLRASRWGARQAGMKSHGILTNADGDEVELFTMTKDEFLQGRMNNG